MRKVGGIIDLRSVAGPTMAAFERAKKLSANNPDLPMREHCRRAGISLSYFWQIEKSLRVTKLRGPLGANQALA